MSTVPKNKALVQANQRAAERARKIAKKMQANTLRKLAENKVARKTIENTLIPTNQHILHET